MARSAWMIAIAASLSACNMVSAETAPVITAPNPPVNMPQSDAERRAYSADDKSPISVVNRFNQMAFFDKKPAEAMRLFLSDDFIERSPEFARDGYANDKQAAIAYFDARGWKKDDPLRDIIYQVIADSDRVVVFHKITRAPDDRGIAFIDIFRVKNGLIAEHWAVGQPVPENTTARHSMF